VGPLNTTKEGYQYLIVAQDYFTKWPIALPTKTTNTEEALDFLWKEICTIYGIPEQVITDQGTAFTSERWKTTSENWSPYTTPAVTTNQLDHQAQIMWSMNKLLCPKSPESDVWEIVVASPDPSSIGVSQSPKPLSPNGADLNYPHGNWNQSDSSSTTGSHLISSPWDMDTTKTMSIEKTTLTTTTTWTKENNTIEKKNDGELVVERKGEEKSSIKGAVI